VSGIGRDVGRLAGLEQDRREVADTHLHRALEDPEALLEAVTVWRRSTARRDEHVQHREPASSLLAGEPHGVPDDGQVRQRGVLGSRDRHLSEVVLGGESRCVRGVDLGDRRSRPVARFYPCHPRAPGGRSDGPALAAGTWESGRELRADLSPEDLIVATSLLCRPLPGTGDWDGLARRQIELMINGLGPTAPLGSGLPS